MLKILTLALSALATTAAAQEMTCVPTRADTERLSRLDQAWRDGRAEAIRSGSGAQLRALGPAADPRVNLNRPQPTPGRYQCRTIKLGAASEGMLPYIAYGWFKCQVALTPGGDLIVRKTTGSQRPVGLVCPDDRDKARFVGVLELGDEVRTPRYGADADRDLIGEVRRIGDDRWRIAFPWPAYESKLDILEMRRTR
ncbi:MAG: DUF4893 domain-containing protein [Alphaproteobacteria bacterium]|nr:DUF4893 domain-containing protein [Alphaproteobacteria bacterium]MBU1513986.1 DUF4893 domain-containing protein [Alphaproteobacteria bacterium]MBU2093074.1 DUF4893 domain-containing protein [Alphaproteobacteria bacterium]MBU2151723.1 DUF4893 domain-containing protein [Alphaproteobacteria bacterium]MBU2309457.1 DUF4893 domain-containing protein [Alphaproteobacteria bacterium]